MIKLFLNYVKKNLYDFFSISDLSVSFFNLNIDVNNSKNITNIKVFNQLIKSNNFPKKKENAFYYESKKFRHDCKFFKKRCQLKKMFFF